MTHTKPCPTFIKELLFRFSDWSVITCWNAIPAQFIFSLISTKFLFINASTTTPDCMKLLHHLFCSWTLLNELLYQLQFMSTASFKTGGIMKDEMRITLKYHLVLNIMFSTLWCDDIKLNIDATNWQLPTFKDGLRADASIWEDTHGFQYLAWTFTIHITFLPFELKMIGFPVALQTLCRIMVLPALACLITRMWNWVNFACIFSICSILNWGFEFEVDIARLIWW